MTDENDMRNALAPLRERGEHISDEAIAALLAGADAARARSRQRTRRVAAGAVCGALALTGVIATLPADRSNAPAGAVALLRATAAVADEQPDATGAFRYTEVIERGTTEMTDGDRKGRITREQRLTQWVDAGWNGHRLTTADGSVTRTGDTGVLGDFGGKPAKAGSEREYMYGDGPLARVPLAELPTDPAALEKVLRDGYMDFRWAPGGKVHWAPGHPTADQIRYELAREELLLLTDAPSSPALRAALYTLLSQTTGIRDLGAVKDELGREGHGIAIPYRAIMTQASPGELRVIVNPSTSEVLEWSDVSPTAGVGMTPPGITPITYSSQQYVYVRAGRVAAEGDELSR